MELREGMLGVVVVALALTGALFASYLAGIDSSEHEVTKYQYLADVSGQFSYDKTPTYVDFDPSSNYVGYYSQDTGEYFPVDEIGYEPNNRVNNYKVNLEPENTSYYNVPFQTISTDRAFDTLAQTVYLYNTYGLWASEYTNPVTVASVIEAMDLPEEINEVYISSERNYNETDFGDITNADVNWNVFSSKSMWEHTDFVDDSLYLWSPQKFEIEGKSSGYNDGSHTYYAIYLSCKVDLKKNLVTFYYDNNFQKRGGEVTLENAVVCYGGGGTLAYHRLTFSNTMDLTAWTTNVGYLDPNYGVTMKE